MKKQISTLILLLFAFFNALASSAQYYPPPGDFFGGTTPAATNITLTASSPGLVVGSFTGNITVTLPLANTCNPGKTFALMYGTGSGGVMQLSTQGSDKYNSAAATNRTVVGNSGAMLFVTTDGISQWNSWGLSSNFNGGIGGGAVLYINGSNQAATTSVGTAGQLLTSAGSGNPTWSNVVLTSTAVSTTQALNATSSKYILASGTITITLTPTANKEWVIFNTDANTKTIAVSSGSLLGTGGGSITAINSSRHYWSDGTNVYLIAANGS